MTDNMSFLEWKHNVLNRLSVGPSWGPVTSTATTMVKVLPKRYPSTKGYGRGSRRP